MPKKQQKKASNKKNARKQTHSKIQFYIGICVTTVKKTILLYSTCPNGQNHQIIEKSLDFKLAREFVIVFIHRATYSKSKCHSFG